MRLRRWLIGLVVLVVIGLGAFWLLTEPRPLAESVLPPTPGDPVHGELLFWAGGCVSCHAAADAVETGRSVLSGGKPLTTLFGIFYPQNISPDPDTGIGRWSTLDFINAMKRGITPDGMHLYPAFPYTSYQRMPVADLVDLKAFLDTLPAVNEANKQHELPFPLTIRRGLGLWKLLFLDGKEFAADPAKSAEINRGGYLVSGPGHCNECHTPRLLFGLGGLDYSHALGGAPNLIGKGRVPNITPGKNGIGDKSADDLLFALEMGQDFNKTMLEVQKNIAHLPDADLMAIVAYLKQVTPIDGLPRQKGGNSGGN